MTWLYLLIAGLMEIGWAVGLKYSEGFTRIKISIITAILMAASYVFLALAIRHIPLGSGYAIWTGIGVAGTAILGIILFAEPVNTLRILCILLILTGIIGLKLTTKIP